MTALWFSCSRLVTSPALSWLLHATMRCPTSAASFFFRLLAELFRKWNVHYANKQRTPWLMQLRGPFTCKSSLISIPHVNLQSRSTDRRYGDRLHLYQSNASARSAESEGCRAASSHRVLVVTDQPELRQIDQILLKQTHTAATTFILEAVKQNADKSTIR